VYRKWWTKIEYPLFLASTVLGIIGLIAILSASGDDTGSGSEFQKQLIYFGIGLLMMLLMTAIDYEFWSRIHIWLYGLNVGLLLLVLFLGHSAQGAQRWISLGSLGTFQPSEIAKLLLILTLARFLSAPEREGRLSPLDILLASIHAGFPMIIVLIQPDLGTSLVFIAVLAAMLYSKGVKPLFLGGALSAGAFVLYFFLKDYQRRRIFAFLNPNSDPTGSGWNIIQSKIAIGSGQVMGKGLFAGTQNQLRFVPEHSTDFIFTVVGEEMGLVGGLALLALYSYILFQAISISLMARESYGSLVAVGIIAMLATHIFVNLGMTMGILPVTGIPLPFISYGGSALITNMMAVGVLASISLRRVQRFEC
jgi:rod shape determining protein RodA